MHRCQSKISRTAPKRGSIQRHPLTAEPMTYLEQLAAVSENAVMITTAAGCITYINPVFEALTGYGNKEICGQDASLFHAGEPDQRLFDYDDIWSALSKSQESGDFPKCFIHRKKNGEFFFIEQVTRPFIAPDGSITHYILTGRDISERINTLHQLARQANHDDLTGLSNRNLFMDRLSQAFNQAARRNDRFAMLYIDLDGFKKINDSLGHAAGDELLRAVATRLRQSVREVDTVARLGGDEFALILPDAKHREDVETVVGKILQAFQEPVIWQQASLAIRASIGASLYPENANSCEQLLQHADKAMYQQKKAGGNGVSHFDHDTVDSNVQKKSRKKPVRLKRLSPHASQAAQSAP